jgi:exopolysaccharide production protein ExoQ
MNAGMIHSTGSIYRESRSLSSLSFDPRRLLQGLLLVLVFLFFSVQGTFSFEGGEHTAASEKGGTLIAVESNVETGRASNFAWVGVVVILLAVRAKKVFVAAKSMPTITCLACLPVISAAWSEDPALSFRRGLFLLLSTLLAYYFFEEYRPREQIRLISVVGFIAAFGSIAVALLFPQYGQDNMVHSGAWQGIYTHKNVCASAMLLFIAPILGVDPGERRSLWAFYWLMLTFLLIMTRSRSGWVVAIMLLVFAGALKLIGRFKNKDRNVVVLVSSVFALGCGWIVALEFDRILSLLGRDATLSGRTLIWSAVFDAIAKRPFLGYGYAAFWSGLRGPSANIILTLGWAVPHAHNGLLDVWLQLGGLGVGLFCLSLLGAVRDMLTCFRPGRPAYIDWYIATVALVIFFSISEPFILEDRSMNWVLYVVACINLRYVAAALRKGKSLDTAS